MLYTYVNHFKRKYAYEMIFLHESIHYGMYQKYLVSLRESKYSNSLTTFHITVKNLIRVD